MASHQRKGAVSSSSSSLEQQHPPSIALGMSKPKRKRKRQHSNSCLLSFCFTCIPIKIGGILLFSTLFVVWTVISTILHSSSSSGSISLLNDKERLVVQNYQAKFLSPHAVAVAGQQQQQQQQHHDPHSPRERQQFLRREKQQQKHAIVIPTVNRHNIGRRHPQWNNHNTTTIRLHPAIQQQAEQEQAILPLPDKQDLVNDPQHDVSLSPEALAMCTRTLWHTLETTTIVLPNQETFIHTGDIDDLWLRDSAAQIHPLLIPVVPDHHQQAQQQQQPHQYRALIYDDMRLDRIVSGLIARHAKYIRHDPYANAFRIDDTYVFSAEQKQLGRHDLISTWNYELDSACYTIRMLYYYWKQARNPLPTLRDNNPAVQQAVQIMVDLWIAEQEHELDRYPSDPQWFDCLNCQRPYRYPGLPRDGKGTLTNASSGLTWSGFRPSDDACQYGYLIPANMFAFVALQYVQEMAGPELWNNRVLQQKARQLQNDIQRGIQEHGIVEHAVYGKIYAYEVDGFGNALLMDDANVPSLLSIPYLEYPYDPVVYANTRRFLLSPDNPTYASGTNPETGPIAGIGSPHMKAVIPQNVWPLALAMQALTTESRTEAIQLTEQLVHATAGTGYMHESFNVHRPAQFTRAWFCWADSLYAELVLRLLLNSTTATTEACLDPAQHQYRVLEWRDPVTVPGGRFARD